MRLEPQGPAPAVVLFDIDGTLVRRSGPHHRQALVEAVRRVTGFDTTTDHIPVQGMLDRQIMEHMMRDAGAPRSLVRRAMPQLVQAAQHVYLRAAPPPALHDRVCPGALALLRNLRRRGVPMGLVTGNLSRIGWKKLERAGLRHYFSFGAFAELAHERAQLVRIALQRARSRGWIGVHTCLWLVGDHPNDILAAKANGLRSIAVATGLSPVEELTGCHPDIVVEDLRALTLESLFHA